MIHISFRTLKQALQNKAAEMQWFLDRQTGQIKLHSEDIDLGDDGAFADQLDIFPDRYILIQPIPDQTQFKIMIDFTNEVKDNRIKVELAQTFAQKRPSIQYMRAIDRSPAIKKQWRLYQDKRHIAYVQEWLADQYQIEATIR